MTGRAWVYRAKGRPRTGGYPMKVRCSRNRSSKKPVTGVYDLSLGNTLAHSVVLMKIKRVWWTHPCIPGSLCPHILCKGCWSFRPSPQWMREWPQIGAEDGRQNSQGGAFSARCPNHWFGHREEEIGNTEVSASVKARTGCPSWKGRQMSEWNLTLLQIQCIVSIATHPHSQCVLHSKVTAAWLVPDREKSKRRRV